MVYLVHDFGFCIVGLDSAGGQDTFMPICVPGFVYINNYLICVEYSFSPVC